MNGHGPKPIQAINLPAPSQVAQKPQPTQQDARIVDSIFAKLTVLFPAKAPKADELKAHKVEWLKVLAVNGICTTEQVQQGLMRARLQVGDRQWWPTPLQFAKWCQHDPADHGLPDVLAAYREAVKYYGKGSQHNWSHPLVFKAMQAAGGSWLLGSGKDSEVFKLFEHHYTVLMRKMLNGEPVDAELPKPLPAKVSRPTSAKESLNKIAQLRQSLNLRGAA